MRLAQRRFYLSDQERFADASGDRNPMHVDALKARRTQAGAPVVHGIHLLLWALDSLATAQPDLPPLRCIRVQFNKFVYLDESVEVVLSQQGPTRARLNISVDDVPRSKVMLDFGDPVEDCPRVSTASPDLGTLQTEPLNLNFESVAGRSGHFRFPMTPEVAAKLFPYAAQWLGAKRIAALAASTYLVGMVCPGLHSIYSELLVCTCAESEKGAELAFQVTETDSSFQAVEQEIAGGGFTGTVRSFVRTPPVEQASMQSLANLVGPEEFSGCVA